MQIKYRCQVCGKWNRQIYMEQRKINGEWSFICERCEKEQLEKKEDD